MTHADAVTTEEGGNYAELLPPVYDYLFTGPVVAGIALAVIALIRLTRTRHDAVTALLALALIVCVPLLGPAAYLYLTRQTRGPASSSG